MQWRPALADCYFQSMTAGQYLIFQDHRTGNLFSRVLHNYRSKSVVKFPDRALAFPATIHCVDRGAGVKTASCPGECLCKRLLHPLSCSLAFKANLTRLSPSWKLTRCDDDRLQSVLSARAIRPCDTFVLPFYHLNRHTEARLPVCLSAFLYQCQSICMSVSHTVLSVCQPVSVIICVKYQIS